MILNKRERAIFLTALSVLQQVYASCDGDLPEEFALILDKAPLTKDDDVTLSEEVDSLTEKIEAAQPSEVWVVVSQTDAGTTVTAHESEASTRRTLHGIIDEYVSGHSALTGAVIERLRREAEELSGFNPVGIDTVDVHLVEIESDPDADATAEAPIAQQSGGQ